MAPDSHAAVTVTLPAGAVTASDGRSLEGSASATVAGPVGIAVADARVEEGDGALLAFVVTLSRAATAAVTVHYATSDGSAQAGVDYTSASGTLSFGSGERSKTVEVAVLDDTHDEGEETLTLTSPSGGSRLTDADATGTIRNRDPLPRALLARSVGRRRWTWSSTWRSGWRRRASRASERASPAVSCGAGWSATWR